MRVVFTNDFLFHGQAETPEVFHGEIKDLLAVVIGAASELPLEDIAQCVDACGEKFDRRRFFSLSGITDVQPKYYLYDSDAIQEESWNYFKAFFGQDVLFIGIELGLDLRRKLTELGYEYVNFWYHSYKLLDDLFFLVGSNSEKIYGTLRKYQVPEAKLFFYGALYAQMADRKGWCRNLPVEDNCCLFVGQTYRDKSIASGGRFLNITDYAERVAQLAHDYSKVYYVPHPCAAPNAEVDDFLRRTPGVEVLENIPTYYLLASPKVRKVVALSSSVVYEARYFGKETEYLFHPLFEIDAPFSLNAFVSVYQDYFSTGFWQEVLSAAKCCDRTFKPRNIDLVSRDQGHFRDLMGLAFGYKFFGRAERIETQLESATQRLSRHDESITNLADADKTLGEAMESATWRLSRHDESISSLANADKTLGEAVASATWRLSRHDESISNLTNADKTLGEAVASAAWRLSRHDESISNLANADGALSHAIESLSQADTALGAALGKASERWEKKRAALARRLDELERRNRALAARLEAVEGNLFVQAFLRISRLGKRLLGKGSGK